MYRPRHGALLRLIYDAMPQRVYSPIGQRYRALFDDAFCVYLPLISLVFQ